MSIILNYKTKESFLKSPSILIRNDWSNIMQKPHSMDMDFIEKKNIYNEFLKQIRRYKIILIRFFFFVRVEQTWNEIKIVLADHGSIKRLQNVFIIRPCRGEHGEGLDSWESGLFSIGVKIEDLLSKNQKKKKGLMFDHFITNFYIILENCFVRKKKKIK